MEIKLEDIVGALRMAETKLLREGKSVVHLDEDNYWIIQTNEWADFSKDPSPAVGSLEDDLQNIKRALGRNEIVSYSEIDSLASLLRAISEKFAPIDG